VTGQPPPADFAVVLAALRRVAPLARAVARAVRTLALVALAAAAVIVAAVLAHGFPRSAAEIVLTLALVALVAAPAVVLFVFYLVLSELLELPERLRDLPRTGREHVEELRRLDRETKAGGRAGWTRVPFVLWRLLDFLRSSTWIFRPYAPVAAVLSPPLLVAVALSAVATVLLVPIALLALVVSALV